jgi:phasin
MTSRTATKTAEAAVSETASVVDFPGFDASKATDQFRVFAEKGVEQSRETYTRLKTGAEEVQKAFEATYEKSRAASNTLSLTAISALRKSAEASFSHLEALAGVKSFSEIVELQTAFVRRSAELALEQGKELQAAASRAATDVSAPAKAAVEKFFRENKVA